MKQEMNVTSAQAVRFVKVLSDNANEHVYTFLSAILGPLPSGEFASEGSVEQLHRERLAGLLRSIADRLLESDEVHRARYVCQHIREDPERSGPPHFEVPAVVRAEFPDLFPPVATAEREPSEEEVLASIRRIISQEDDAVEATVAEEPSRPKPRLRKRSA